MQFVFEKDLQQATQEIRDEISGIRNDLPPEMEEPILTRLDPADLPIVSLTLSSPTLSGPELTRIADPDITRRLRGIQGIGEVTVIGKIERELAVDLRPRDLQASGVSVARSSQALQAQNLAAPVGRLNRELDERTIRLRGRLEAPADFAQLIVSRVGRPDRAAGRRRRPCATAPRSRARRRSTTTKMRSASTSSSRRASARRRWPTMCGGRWRRSSTRCPSGISLRIVRDAGTRVEASVGNVEEALVEGAVLTVLVVFLFLNSWRSTVITGLALPVSVLASFIAVWAFGFTLNTMSLLGLSLAIGILIDDAIVVRENIVRHVDMGKDHYQRVVRRHRRNRPGGGGDDLLDRRRVRADRVHGRHRRAVVRAVRADHRLLGAGVAVRLVLARPDAVGVLARSALRDGRAARGCRACSAASTTGSIVRPIATSW